MRCFGDYSRCKEDQLTRLPRTSGTTGRPLQLANRRGEVATIARIGGRAMLAAGRRLRWRSQCIESESLSRYSRMR